MAPHSVEPHPAGRAATARPADRPIAHQSLLRNHGGGHAPVSYLELFFDLVFVFAITQLSQTLLHHLSWRGLAESIVLFLAVWWAWIYTTWVTNWANPDRVQIRVLLLALMLLSLTMAAAVPGAFAERAGIFAASYLAIQLGRSGAMAVLFRREGANRVRNMVRITAWFAASAPMWIAGAMAAESDRLWLWLGALAIEYAGPMAMFRTPGMGRSLPTDWDISGSHMAERCALFIIIALGEGIVVTGTSFAGQAIDAARANGFVLAFLSAALMWWLYFDLGAERGARLISGHDDVGRVARNAYTYLHMPIVLAVVIGAVGDALLLEQANAPASHAFILIQTGSAVLFLTGLGLFKRVANTLGNFPMSHGVAIGLFYILAFATWTAPPAADRFTALSVAILALTCLWEWVSYHGGWVERMEAAGLPIPTWFKDRAERRRAAREANRA